MSTTIEWTQRPGTKGETWNPTTGCAKVSAGCKNCYAEKMHARLTGMGSAKYKEPFTRVRTWDDALRIPLKWKKPRTVFVNSMSDLFHADVPFEFIDRVFAVMALTPQHTYQILTKRPDRMAEYFGHEQGDLYDVEDCVTDWVYKMGEPEHRVTWPLPNVWLGTSVENQQTADERIPHLLNCPAAVRFLSCEPLLGAVELPMEHLMKWAVIDGKPFHKINWVIAGGESGPKARPMHPEWVRGLRDRCKEAGVAFFFKQWGQWVAPEQYGHREGEPCLSSCTRIGLTDGSELYNVGKHNSSRRLDGVEHSAFPQSNIQ
jgi:protein gp37